MLEFCKTLSAYKSKDAILKAISQNQGGNAQVHNAIEYLKIIGVLDQNENLTVLGRHLTILPLEPKLGKMLILGAILNCLDPVLTVVTGLSVRDHFLMPLDKKDPAEAAKSHFSGDYSDQLVLVRAYEGWKAAARDLSGYECCWENSLSTIFESYRFSSEGVLLAHGYTSLLMATQPPAIHVAMTSIWFEQFFAMASILKFAPVCTMKSHFR